MNPTRLCMQHHSEQKYVCLKRREERGNEMESVHRYKCMSAGKRCHWQDLYNSFYWSMQYWKQNSWSGSSTKVPAWGPCPTSIWKSSSRFTSFTMRLWNSLRDSVNKMAYICSVYRHTIFFLFCSSVDQQTSKPNSIKSSLSPRMASTWSTWKKPVDSALVVECGMKLCYS